MKKVIALMSILITSYAATAQAITADSVMTKVAKGKPYTLVILKPGIPEPKDEKLVNKMQMDHLINLFQMEKDGKISIFGPVMNDKNLTGIIIFNSTDITAIKKDLDSDPFIKAGYMKYEMYNWFSIPGQKIPEL